MKKEWGQRESLPSSVSLSIRGTEGACRDGKKVMHSLCGW